MERNWLCLDSDFLAVIGRRSENAGSCLAPATQHQKSWSENSKMIELTIFIQYGEWISPLEDESKTLKVKNEVPLEKIESRRYDRTAGANRCIYSHES